jgi:TusE/DsrC/DsvC family sulfur relay protein
MGGGMARATVHVDKVQTATEAAAEVREVAVEVNERGFMKDPSQWSPGAALFLARRQGLRDWPRELMSDHWRVIDYTRTYYEATGNAPSLRYTCRALGMTKRQFSRLFPGGLMTVRRISGLAGPRRSANRRELTIAQQLMTRNWWEHLTSVDLPDVVQGGTVAPADTGGNSRAVDHQRARTSPRSLRDRLTGALRPFGRREAPRHMPVDPGNGG